MKGNIGGYVFVVIIVKLNGDVSYLINYVICC